jgi:hypothetical protein
MHSFSRIPDCYVSDAATILGMIYTKENTSYKYLLVAFFNVFKKISHLIKTNYLCTIVRHLLKPAIRVFKTHPFIHFLDDETTLMNNTIVMCIRVSFL